MEDDKLRRAIDLAREATVKDTNREYAAALELYKQSLDYWFVVVKYQANPVLKRRLQEKMDEYTTRAEYLKEYLDKQYVKENSNNLPTGAASNGRSRQDDGTRRSSAKAQQNNNTASTNNNRTGGAKDNEERNKCKDSLAGVLVTSRPNVQWTDVAGLDGAKSALREAVLLPIKLPQFFTGNLKPWKGILLYGPPGTGKTFLAQACATATEGAFISATSADLMSKWQGESEKAVRALFDTARDNKPAVVFIDEIDCIGGVRGESNESESTRRLKTEFLVQMDGLDGGSSQVMILAATNTPWDLDPAFRRRFERRIYIPLPDYAARRHLLELGVSASRHQLSEADVTLLAERLDGYSGADISVLVRDALLQGLRKMSSATHFKKAVDAEGVYRWIPTTPDDPSPTRIEANLMELNPERLEAPQVTMEDFASALLNVRATNAREDIQRYVDWTAKLGMDGV
eukprot:Lankesteria_metandrocarpae@DN3872_c0_g1_i1.p1